ncbi:MAG: polysaccharide deacetylase family protein, partial [Paraclostridium sp.]
YNMKATFFLLEGKMKDNPEIVKKILKEGHAIGLHGQTHEKKLFYANSLSVLKEVEHSRDYFKSLTNSDTKLVRVPYGSKPHLTKNQYYSLVENGYNMWDWNIDSTDTHKDASSSKIISHTLSEIDNYKTPVILFHDKKVTVDALPSILKYLYKNNYDSKSIQQEHPPMNWWNKTLY